MDGTSKYRNRWTEAELALLREFAGTKPAREIARLVGHTLMATQMKMCMLRLQGFRVGAVPLPPDAPRAMGTPEQQAAIRAAGSTQSSEALARQLGLSPNTVRRYAQRLGVALKRTTPWTAAEDQALRETAHQGAKAAALATGRTLAAVDNRARLLHIRFVRPQAKKMPARVRRVAAPVVRVVATKKQATPLRQVEYRGSRIEYCQQCGAPVSNWEKHFERMGHRRNAA